jgi:hypothetical protein
MRSASLFLLVALTAGCGRPAPASSPARDFLIGGIQVNERDHGAWVEALVAAGLNAVEVTVYARQGDWDSANLWWEADGPWVVAETRAAKARGLDVVLVLRVALDHAYPKNRFFWHGMIMPAADEEVGEWFRRYADFVGQWAVIAEREGIGTLAIGSEMNSLASTVPVAQVPVLEEYWSHPEKVAHEQGRLLARSDELAGRSIWMPGGEGYERLDSYLSDQATAHREWARRVAFLDAPNPAAAISQRRRLLAEGWTGVIDRARAAYSGRLTYAANFDQYREVGFWKSLDLLAINAYFPLRESLLENPSEDELLAALRDGWRSILTNLDTFRREAGIPTHPVLFTELGYTARTNSTLQPWASTGVSVLPAPEGDQLVVWEDQPADPTERTLAVRALREVHGELGDDLLAGILYWKLSTVPSHRDVEPFVVVLGEQPEDPLLTELRRLRPLVDR